jgi:SAM-dependent methyltransferase
MAVETKPLFHPEVIRQQLAAFTLPAAADAAQEKLQHWANLISSGKADSINEKALLPDFLTDFFLNLLGYTAPAGSSDTFTLSRETHVVVDGQFTDAALGRFSAARPEYIVAVEGKGTRDPLDRPFAGRKMSAVDQAYRYAINFPCDWIIVTSMRETRLYHKGSNQQTYERFETVRLANDPALLRRFIFLLGAERVVPEAGECHLYSLLHASTSVGRRLTNDFYASYAELRHQVFAGLRDENTTVAPQEILRSTQKLLDRILFCAFCEDRQLLPAETVQQAFIHRDPYNPKPIWENFRGLFRAVDRGDAGLRIPAYNGGLFALDPVVDSLVVPDRVCALFRDLAEYDYRPPREVADEEDSSQIRSVIDVDILGHIFEQSITDLERIRQDIDAGSDGVKAAEATARRKKEGAFYTPPFITRYIVEQTLGGTVRSRFETLRREHETEATGTARKSLANPDAYDLGALNDPQRKALIRFWEAWQDVLKGLRILDPACGSGAFLIEAFDQLHALYESSNSRLEDLRGQRTLFDLDRQILQHNLYGVDLSAEAIQICQLSLWIKTAARGKALTSLDHTIREGNSVVQDPAVHPKAFDWRTCFPEVFEQGGFDVVIGNPPYIRQEWIAAYKPYWEQRYRSYHGVADIFVYFYEQGTELLRPGGQLAFITSGSWVRGNFGAPLRRFLSTDVRMISMVDFGEFQPFEDAEMIRPTIAIAEKAPPDGEMRLFKWLTSGRPPETLSDEIAKAPTVRSERFGKGAWELESEAAIQLREKLASKGRALSKISGKNILMGIKPGTTEAFIVDAKTRKALVDASSDCEALFRPFTRGQDIRPWHLEDSGLWIISLCSSDQQEWPWTKAGANAEQVFTETYPSIREHMRPFEPQLKGRVDNIRFWWELRSCGYWDQIFAPRIAWPDITNRPRFALDYSGSVIGDTGFMIPGEDPFLLGVLASWATWFFISKTAQPLRLRSDRWQYRLKGQYMDHVPIPDASAADRAFIAESARRCTSAGQERYALEMLVRRRLREAFGNGSALSLNQKAEAWWERDLIPLGDAVKQSFKLSGNPLKSPRVADEWEPYLVQKRADHARLTRLLADIEGELNDRVYRLFELTSDEITLLQKDVEH